MTDVAMTDDQTMAGGQDSYALTLDAIMASVNLIDMLPTEKIASIASDVIDGYRRDRQERGDLELMWEQCHDLAAQVAKEKTYPWPRASNVKYPLLTVGTIQFAARAYPSLVNGNRPVAVRTAGFDPTGEKGQRAERISRHMSWQMLDQMKGWEESQDRLCHITPIYGCAFKKVYRDHGDRRNCSELVMPQDMVVPRYTKSFHTTPRATHVLHLWDNEVRERQNAGIWADVDLGPPSPASMPTLRNEQTNTGDLDAPRSILEQHCWYDLDDDDYKEPYVVTVDESTGKMLRMVARFEPDGIVMEGDRLIRIEPVQYFVKYGFIPSFDGGFYDIGFGHLLGPINEVVNTTINQTIDAATLANMQGGFLGKGLRIRSGQARFQPGEWKPVDVRGGTIRDNVYPLPVKDPSPVVFNLLNLMISAGKEMASITDIMMGNTPGQNTPASTTLNALEQGVKVYTAIVRRMWRAFSEEVRLLFALNRKFVDYEEEFRVLDTTPDDRTMKAVANALFEKMVVQGVNALQQAGMPPQEADQMARQMAAEEFQQITPQEIAELAMAPEFSRVLPSDYQDDGLSVYPAADPQAASDVVRRAKADFVVQSMQMPMPAPVNPMAVWKMAFEAYGIDNVDALLVQPNPEPPLEAQLAIREADRHDADTQARIENNKVKTEIEAFKAVNEVKDKSLDVDLKVGEAVRKDRAADRDDFKASTDADIRRREAEIARKQAERPKNDGK
jgi:hypothetical protein